VAATKPCLKLLRNGVGKHLQVSKLAPPKYESVGDGVQGFRATLAIPGHLGLGSAPGRDGVSHWEGSGRTRRDAETACAVRACEQLAALGKIAPKHPKGRGMVMVGHGAPPALPAPLALPELLPTGTEPFLDNPKSALAHCWQTRGIGQPVYDDTAEYAVPPFIWLN
jgi:hypothetical protein